MFDSLAAGRSSRSIHRSLLARGLCTLLIVAMSVPSSLAQSSPPGELDFEDAVKMAADRPLTSTPLRWRRGVIETLLPVAVEASGEGVLPAALVRAIQQDNDGYFLDEGHIRGAVVFRHDLQLIQRLVALLRNPSGDDALYQACFHGLIPLILADRQMTDQAVREAGQALAAMQDPRSAVPAGDVQRAAVELGLAQTWFDHGLGAMRQGNAETAAAHFLKAWGHGARVLGIGRMEFGRDADGDGVVDVVELRLGSSPLVADTDDDGLSDHYELQRTLPQGLPTSADTDGDGVPDGQQDFDEDELTTLAERDLGTDPLLDDTDGDGILDGEEIDETGTDPRLADTDGDGLRDDDEARLKTNGRNPDTDGDGIPDGEDEHAQSVGDGSLGVRVTLVGVGAHFRRFRAHSLASHGGLGEVPGLVGDFVDLTTDGTLRSARVRMRYDPEMVPDADFANLRLLRYDPVARSLEVLPNPQVDAGAHEVSADTTVLSPVGVVHLPSWESSASPAAAESREDAPAALPAEPRLDAVEEAVPPFPRLPICGDQDGSETPLVLNCPDFEFTPVVQTYQVPGSGPVGLNLDFVFREAGFNNELGFFLVDTAAGAIGRWRPGERGYLPAALSRARVIFGSGSDAFAGDVHVPLRGGDILGFFLVQNGRLSVLRQRNRTNRPDWIPVAFFSLDAATPDGLDHFVGFRKQGSPVTQFGFEDVTGGGDRDYDDVVYNVIPRLEPLTGFMGLRPLRAARTVGESQAFTATLRDGSGDPLPDVTLTFTVTGANPRVGTATTGSDGSATFSYAGDQPGEDSIAARASGASSNAALVTWVSPVPADSDHDGLTDAQETAGFLTQFGYRVSTDPFRADTDGDGIPDGDEVIARPEGISPVFADPTKADTDGDGLDDFRELYGLGLTLNTFDPDTDGDGLSDGEEVDEHVTDPSERDSDGDGFTDGQEVQSGSDPLVDLPRVDPALAAREFAIGALCGEFCIDDPAHGNLAFFAGFMVSGTISLIPTPITIVLGLIADLRDFFASLWKADWLGAGINAVALVPSIGDTADAVATMGKFLAKHPEVVFPVVLLVSKMDGLPDAAREALRKAGYAENILGPLRALGFTEQSLGLLILGGVDLTKLAEHLPKVVKTYPLLPSFLAALKEADLLPAAKRTLIKPFRNFVSGGFFNTPGRSNKLTVLYGAFGEWLMKNKRVQEDRWRVLADIIQSRWTTSPGYDLAASRMGFVRLIDAKVIEEVLDFKVLKNYLFTGSDGALRFNDDYFDLQNGFVNELSRRAFHEGKLEVEIFVVGPEFEKTEKALRLKMGAGESGRIFAKYFDLTPEGELVERTVEVILTCFNQLN